MRGLREIIGPVFYVVSLRTNYLQRTALLDWQAFVSGCRGWVVRPRSACWLGLGGAETADDLVFEFAFVRWLARASGRRSGALNFA